MVLTCFLTASFVQGSASETTLAMGGARQPVFINPSSLSTFPDDGRRAVAEVLGRGMVRTLFSLPSQSVTSQTSVSSAKEVTPSALLRFDRI